MRDSDPEKLADELEEEADQLAKGSGRVRDKTAAVREDWERKRVDQNVPGAPAPEGEDKAG